MIGSAAVITAACAERISGTLGTDLLDAAFTSIPLGFESTANSFSGSSSDGSGQAFMPDGGRHGGRGPSGMIGGFDFMGGGFGGDFIGGHLGGGRPFDRGGLPSACTFSASTGIVTCPTETRGGLTITRTAIFKTASGTAQASFDSTTNSVTNHIEVAGTITRRDSIKTTVSHKSDQTVTGFVKGSTQRTVNGTSAGTESTTGTDSSGTFTVARVVGDTTSGLIIPLSTSGPSFPTAGSIIRSMQVTLTYSGKSPVTASRREVVTYDGSGRATIVITQNGTTKNCTVQLPHGRPTCS
jgi:hypothetical protein